jgi:hypothetical protein
MTSLATRPANRRLASKLLSLSLALIFRTLSRSSVFEPSKTRASAVIFAFPKPVVAAYSVGGCFL